MVKYMMESGKMASNMGLECGKASKEILMLGNGMKVRHMDLVSMFGTMVTGTKVNGNSVKNMEMEQMYSQMKMYILDNILKVIFQLSFRKTTWFRSIQMEKWKQLQRGFQERIEAWERSLEIW
jgi:hypothetical protein